MTRTEPWGAAANGDNNAYAGLNGLVAKTNGVGVFFAYIPPPNVLYESGYLGMRVDVMNLGDGSYMLRQDGATPTRHAYEARYASSRYFDAAGQPIRAPEEASVMGSPQGMYFSVGPMIVQSASTGESGSQGIVSVIDEVAYGEAETAASNGDDAYASPSGMVAKINARGFWCGYVPQQGATYDSVYWGMSVKVKNLGDRYELQWNGARSTHRFASMWEGGAWFDAAGQPVADFDDAAVPGQPQAAYFTPGPRWRQTSANSPAPSPAPAPAVRPAPAAVANQGITQPSATPAPPRPGSPPVIRPSPVVSNPGSIPSQGPFLAPGTAPFPGSVNATSPSVSDMPGMSGFAKLALGAVALWSLLK